MRSSLRLTKLALGAALSFPRHRQSEWQASSSEAISELLDPMSLPIAQSLVLATEIGICQAHRQSRTKKVSNHGLPKSLPYVRSLPFLSHLKLNICPLIGSEEMSLVQLYIPTEVAHDTISELGVMGNFQFKDVSQHAKIWHDRLLIALLAVERRDQRLPAVLRWRDPTLGRDGTSTPPIPEPNRQYKSADWDHAPFSVDAVHLCWPTSTAGFRRSRCQVGRA